MIRRTVILPLLSLVFLSISACNMDVGGPGPRVWIDSPLDGSTVTLGPVVVQSHSASPAGTAQVTLLVNGSEVQIDMVTDAANNLVAFSQVWVPRQDGEYTLQVVGLDHDGNESRSNTVRVRVGGAPPEVPPTDVLITDFPVTGITSTPDPGLNNQPTLTLVSNANCREGPATVYEVVDAYFAGQQFLIVGQNDSGSWFVVSRPGSSGTCWVSGSTGTPSGPYGSVQVIAAPVQPQKPPEPDEPPEQPQPVQPPAAPSNFNVSTQSCSSEGYMVALNWGDVGGEQGYRIYRDGGLIATLGEDATSYSDNSPDFNSHSYVVEAFNVSGTANGATKNSEGCLY